MICGIDEIKINLKKFCETANSLATIKAEIYWVLRECIGGMRVCTLHLQQLQLGYALEGIVGQRLNAIVGEQQIVQLLQSVEGSTL